jgi:sarcosine oxidase subunit gamma
MTAPAKPAAEVEITACPPVARLNLRIAPADLAAASKVFGLTLPGKIGAGVAGGDRSAWCLGPDEWLLHAPERDQAAIVAAFAGIRAATPHSLTVISDRELTFSVTGRRAEELLSVGCPIDLSRMPPGTARRTVFDSAQVVLIRDGAEAFRLEVWRSFAPHVRELLDLAAREIASGF